MDIVAVLGALPFGVSRQIVFSSEIRQHPARSCVHSDDQIIVVFIFAEGSRFLRELAEDKT